MRGLACRFDARVMLESIPARNPVDLVDALLTAVHHAFFILGHGRRALCASTAFCELSGYTLEEFLALPSTGIINEPDDLPNASQALNQALAGEPPNRRSRNLVRSGGSLVPVESSAKLLRVRGSSPLLLAEFWPRDGRLYPGGRPGRDAASPSVRDLSPTIDPADLLGGLLETLTHAFFTMGQRRSKPLISNALCQLSGYDQHEFGSLEAAELPFAPPEAQRDIRRTIQGALAGEPPRRVRREMLRAGGGRVEVDASVSLMPVDGGSPLVLVEFWPLSDVGALADSDAA